MYLRLAVIVRVHSKIQILPTSSRVDPGKQWEASSIGSGFTLGSKELLSGLKHSICGMEVRTWAWIPKDRFKSQPPLSG